MIVAEAFEVSMDAAGLDGLQELCGVVQAAALEAARGDRRSAFADLALAAGNLAVWAAMAAREVAAGGAGAVQAAREEAEGG
jgi:hypothetical protein